MIGLYDLAIAKQDPRTGLMTTGETETRWIRVVEQEIQHKNMSTYGYMHGVKSMLYGSC